MAAQLHTGAPSAVDMDSERLRAVSRLAAEWVADGHTSGLVVLVARRGTIVLHEGYGRLRPEPDAPPLPKDAIFPIASISKPITATALMCLVDDGRVGLHRPVQEYVPEFIGEGKEHVMVHHLLSHTSGIRDADVIAHNERLRGVREIPASLAGQHPAVAQNLGLGFDAPLWKAPGVEMSYCNFGFQLQSEIIRRVSGRPLETFAHERIFEPLGMTDTYFIVPEAVRERIARRWPPGAPETGYAAILETRAFEENPSASAGAFSTALDLAIFGQMFLQHGRYGDVRVLSPASVAAMTSNQSPGVGMWFEDEYFPEASWGLGWHVHGNMRARRGATLYSAETFEHIGMGGTYLWVDPVHEVVGVYFSLLRTGAAGLYPAWRADLFVNAVTAVIDA